MNYPALLEFPADAPFIEKIVYRLSTMLIGCPQAIL
jgi:hypothetical protein